MRLALVGDIHIYRLFVPPWELGGKALGGQANVWLNRRRQFDRGLIRPVLERVVSIKPDLLLLSGDLTSIGAGQEFARLAELFKPLEGKVPIVAVPGNHDRYTFTAARTKRMERYLPGLVPDSFPHLRVLNEQWKLLALNTAVPRFFTARGCAGREQLDKARELIKRLPPGEGLIVLSHYALGTPSPLPPMRWGHRLADAGALLEIMGDHPGPVFYLHGHVHYPWSWRLSDAGLNHVVDINAGAPALTGGDFPRGQGFWQIDLPPGPARTDNVVLTRQVPTKPGAGGDKVLEWTTEQVHVGRVEIGA